MRELLRGLHSTILIELLFRVCRPPYRRNPDRWAGTMKAIRSECMETVERLKEST